MDNSLNIDHVVEGPLAIWSNGTSGAPYTLAVLALGILLENRFPDKCFMWGEYSDEQVEQMRIWVSAVLQENMNTLICKVHAINHEEEFSLKILLAILVSEGIVINPYQNDSEIVKEWNNRDKTLTTPMEDFNMTILRMSGFPSRIDFYISADKLIEIFGCTEPKNGKEFQEIIERGTKKTQENYRKLAEVTEQLEEKASEEKPDNSISFFQTKSALIRRKYLPSEDYILYEVENQSRIFPQYKEISLVVAKSLRQIIKMFKDEPEYFDFSSLKEAKNRLTGIIFEKFNLRDTAWQAIDDEEDLDILKMLIAYAAHPQNELYFSEMRKFIFETPELWADMRNAFLKNRIVAKDTKSNRDSTRSKSR
jgi:hypothetical protein